ncbi:MAG: TrkH family potassium uptake protein [Clostridia bacterium]|nr:TrkH family potassium uptake protein [Clostridia bacterium]
MNRKLVFQSTGKIIFLESLFLLLPALVSLIYLKTDGIRPLWSFLLTAGIGLAVGLPLMLFLRPNTKNLFAREGFAVTALSWLSLSLLGCLPFLFSGEIPSFFDAFFETASGFSTTGASIVTDFTVLSHGVLFWRSFTHWIGGMGILVLIIAIFPTSSGRNIHILRAEMPGPIVGKLVPKARRTAAILYGLYIGLTVLEFLFLLFGGLPVFESIVFAVGTAGTGGFAVLPDSIASYTPYVQWVITAFMFLFGVNFNLYYLLLIRRAKQAFKSSELWTYSVVIVCASVMLFLNIRSLYPTVSEAIRHSVFQTISIITTSGFGTASINNWPTFSKGLLLLLMFLGGCAGSTAGGLKVSRVMLLFKSVKQDLKKMIHPRAVTTVHLEGKPVDERTLNVTRNYFILYCILLALLTLLLSVFAPEGFTFETNFSAAVSCFNNIGPAYGAAADSYAGFPDVCKVFLSVAMLLGRLEIYPLLIGLSPSTWTKKQA